MAAPTRISRVELERSRLQENGKWVTWTFTFPGRRRPNFIRPENMPEADRQGDWLFAWYEVSKVGLVWHGLRRLAHRIGDEEWTPQSPGHEATGGSGPRRSLGHASVPPRAPSPPGKIKYLGSSPLIDPMTFGQFLADGISLRVSCHCGRTVYLPGDALVRTHGAETTVGQISRRLTCTCGRNWPSIAAVIVGWQDGMRLPDHPRWPPKRRREPEWPNG